MSGKLYKNVNSVFTLFFLKIILIDSNGVQAQCTSMVSHVELNIDIFATINPNKNMKNTSSPVLYYIYYHILDQVADTNFCTPGGNFTITV